jgi:hypothetical protein
MLRAVNEILDPSPGQSSFDRVWEHFRSECAYCGQPLDKASRQGHMDHADPVGGNHIRNRVLACGACNGDEKREMPWREFLRLKVSDARIRAAREKHIEDWLVPRRPAAASPEAEKLRSELEQMVEDFGTKCAELRTAVANTASSSRPLRARPRR